MIAPASAVSNRQPFCKKSYGFRPSSSSLLCNTYRTVTRSHCEPGENTTMKPLLLLACLGLSYASAANAESSLRCKGRIIKVGVPAAYVLSECGDPDNQVFQESVATSGTVFGNSRVIGLALSEQWVYDRGWGRFPAVLFFLDGTLRRIDFITQRSDRGTRAY